MLNYFDINDKRFRIMKAAAKIFADKGFHRAKMEEIAQEADVGKGTVYEYFPSKQQLFIEMFKAGRDYYLNLLAVCAGSDSPIYEKIKRIACLHLTFFKEHKDLARVMMQEFLQLGKEMQETVIQAQEQEIGVLDRLFQQGIDEGYFRPIDPKLTAYAFYGAVNVMGGPMLFHGAQPDLEKLSEEIVDIFIRGIEKQIQS